MKNLYLNNLEVFGRKITVNAMGMFSATDFYRAGHTQQLEKNRTDVPGYFFTKGTKNWIARVMEVCKLDKDKVHIPGQGRGSHTWVHPLILLDLALYMFPEISYKKHPGLLALLTGEITTRRKHTSGGKERAIGALWSNTKNLLHFKSELSGYNNMIHDSFIELYGGNAQEEGLRISYIAAAYSTIPRIAQLLRDNQQIVRAAIAIIKKGG
ncbi:MAG: hypothetical protein DRJ03_07380 [Chloroflexi bacterium]|nr:MAG: hypothetical protein DRJ03_07380 [Chloroflexota bacterium]